MLGIKSIVVRSGPTDLVLVTFQISAADAGGKHPFVDNDAANRTSPGPDIRLGFKRMSDTPN